MTDPLPFSAAAERNRDPILTVLESVLPAHASVLEIASGTGQHVCYFATRLPGTRWQPTEPDESHRAAIAARVRAAGLSNVAPPQALDVHAARWPVDAAYDAVVCINMIHIAPWPACAALCLGAARHLRAGGLLVLYGPYLENGAAVQSNLDFDASLRQRNAEWGLRELEDVTRVAAAHGLRRQQVARMPANNLTLVLAKDETN